MKYHYVYKIKNKINQMEYIGVRSSTEMPINDLGKKYFSSSTDKDFISEQILNPSNFEYIILKEFDTRKNAAEYEEMLHYKWNVKNNPLFYNKCNSNSAFFDVSGIPLTEEHKLKISKNSKGHKKSIETRKKMSEWQKGIKKSEEHRKKLSESRENRKRGEDHHMYGKTHSPEAKKKISDASKNRVLTEDWKHKIGNSVRGEKNGNYGKKFSEEHRLKISKSKIGKEPSNKGKKEESVTCPYCNTSGGRNAMQRWHFDNCKLKNI
jgi:hypothetical protein